MAEEALAGPNLNLPAASPAPGGWADQVVLAHGISSAFQLAVAFAALALAVALVVVRARTPREVPVESS